MAAIIEAGRLEWGIQLPIQSLSTRVSMEWEREGGTIDDMADELTEAAEDLPSIGEIETRSEKDPVGEVIASHRP